MTPPELLQLKRDVLYRGRVFDLIVDQVQYPSGNTGIREVAHHPGGAVCVPMIDHDVLLMVQQLRYPFGKHILELPAGKLDLGEDPMRAAARELEEETGWTAGSLEKLTSIYTTPGFCDEELHIYLATDLTQSAQGPRREEGEFSMTVHHIRLTDAVRMVVEGEIKDGKSIAGILLADRKLNGARIG